jgi:hypothetical protein
MATYASVKKEIEEYQELISNPDVPKDEKEFAKTEIAKLEKQLEGFQEIPASKAAPVEKPKKPAPAKKAAKAKPAPAKKPRERKIVNKNLAELNFEVNDAEGKPVKIKLTEANCYQVMEGLANRLTKSKAANKAYSTKPVVSKAGDTMEQVAKHVVAAVPENRIEDKPKEVLKGVEKMEKGWEFVFEGFEEMTGKKIPAETQKEIRASLDKIKEEATAAV